MKPIVVATDSSEGASRAVDDTAHWATRDNLNLLIVNIIGGNGLPDKAFMRFMNAQTAWLDELLASLSANTPKEARDRAWAVGAHMTALESRSGPVVPALIDVANEKNAEAIVVGKRGSGRVAGLLLGGISQALLSFTSGEAN